VKYLVYAHVVGTAFLGEIEAEDEAQALEKAADLNRCISLCHQCAQEVSGGLELEDIFVEED
jgi:hypothetical protein